MVPSKHAINVEQGEDLMDPGAGETKSCHQGDIFLKSSEVESSAAVFLHSLSWNYLKSL